MSRVRAGLTAFFILVVPASAWALPSGWEREWPKTDFSRHSVDLDDIFSGGPPKDGIPPIDSPEFVPVAEADLADNEPVVGLAIGGEARAYPLRILMWHEIVNDTLGGVPVSVTYCPLCNTSIVFDRRVGDDVLDFGTTGKLRNSDLVMYDRQTESWWQQFLGEAIVGEMTGTLLDMIPSRLESFARFRDREPDGEVLVPNSPSMRSYGHNPYRKYDSSDWPFLYRGERMEDIAPLARVVRVGNEAWALDLVKAAGTIETDDLRITWESGQASALDTSWIPDGFDVGNVTVAQKTEAGWEDAVYSVDFAFAFRAFFPDAPIHTE